MAQLLLLFIFLPFIELVVLLQVGKALGTGYTILLVLGTGIAGMSLVRQQGSLAWHRFTQDVQQGRLPAESLVEAILVLAGSLLLVTPGLITDGAGLLLLVPVSRRVVAKVIMEKLRQRLLRL